MSLNKEMGNAHEEKLALALGGRMTKGSGNQWSDPADGRNNRMKQQFALAWDGKSTYAKSSTITWAMWEKLEKQASPEIPLLGIRFYDPDQGTSRLAVKHDLIVVKLDDFAEMLWHVRRNG